MHRDVRDRLRARARAADPRRAGRFVFDEVDVPPRHAGHATPPGAFAMAVVGLVSLPPLLWVSLAMAWRATDEQANLVRGLSIFGIVVWFALALATVARIVA